MDISGTIDLPVSATRLDLPVDATQSDACRLITLSEQSLDVTPFEWRETQLVRLALASALEARLLHVQLDRLAAFSLTRDPDRVTLRQLAALWRAHKGTAGQAFELAVADAVERRVPEVIQAIAAGLRLLNIADADDFQMVVLGLEKVPADQAQAFYKDLGRILPDEARMRNGMSGRPASVRTALDQLASSSWTSMSRGDPMALPVIPGFGKFPEGVPSQLGRADALLFTPTAVVAASMKIQRSAVGRYGWKDVPLWISTSPFVDDFRVTTVRGPHPLVSVELSQGQWVRHFRRALDVLDDVLECADLGRPSPRMPRQVPGYALARGLLKRSGEPIAQIVEELRAVDPGVSELFRPQTRATQVGVEVPLLSAKPLVNAWRQDAASATVVLGQQHLFFKSPGVGVNPARR